MKRLTTQKETGAVLLLILGLMTMFAMIVLTFMIVTTNMAETAKYASEKDLDVGITPEDDAAFAIKTLLLGTNNKRCPLGPLGIMENLYGHNPDVDLTFLTKWEAIRDDNGDIFLKVTMNGNNDFRYVNNLLENTGNILTIGNCDWSMNTTINEISDCDHWDHLINGKSVIVSDKELITDNGQTSILFRIQSTKDIENFFNLLYNKYGVSSLSNVSVRVNRPMFSGTGAGYFSPATNLDAQEGLIKYRSQDGTESKLYYGFPFACWGNPSAPDIATFTDPDNTISPQLFWAHLLDGNYDSQTTDLTDPQYYRVPVNMSAPYTAADTKSLFLARRNELGITPSFYRPELFAWFVGNLEHMANKLNGATSIEFLEKNGSKEKFFDKLCMLRKLTPRPLPMDHWNFDGSNPSMTKYGNNGPQNRNDMDLEVETFAQRAAYNYFIDSNGERVDAPFFPDVDNDNDGVRDGIWVPSGLPIRTDKNGTPYATMYSYTVLDLDGRTNVNTAGNWDQVPNFNSAYYNKNTKTAKPFSFLFDLKELDKMIVNRLSDSPFYNVELPGDAEWRDDNNEQFAQNEDGDFINKYTMRGSGLGASSVLLYESLNNMLSSTEGLLSVDDDSLPFADRIVSNILWHRNTSNAINETKASENLLDAWNNVMSTRTALRQPGYQDDNNNEFDSDKTKKYFFQMMRPTYFGSSAETGNADPELVFFPYRGKVRIFDYAKNWKYFPDFNFTDSGFRSYDALGHERMTYSPQNSENPYLVYQNHFSAEDSPFTVSMLEKLLRPWDTDTASLPSTLYEILGDLNINRSEYTLEDGSMIEGERLRKLMADEICNKLSKSITTLSSDIPAASMVFPIPGADKKVIKHDEDKTQTELNFQDGVIGITELIRRCVRHEVDKNFNNFISNLKDNEKEDINNFIEDTTLNLVSMLPKEIRNGQKIDLNQLSKKSYWNDLVIDGNGNFEKYDNAGNLTDNARFSHNYGLVKRMEYARGLYILLMTLTYHDRYAGDLYPKEEYTDIDNKDYSNYFEKGFCIDDLKKDADKELFEELTATRIAQWIVNLIDFSDPDATMTPFYFDINPFDGWWTTSSYQTTIVNGNEIREIIFDDVVFSETINTDFFQNAFANPDSIYTRRLDENGNNEDITFAQDITKWLCQKETEEGSTPPVSDLGFRLVWGMERPDLVLTETMSFHDLKIADTREDNNSNLSGNEKYSKASGKGQDPTFDQVARPVGSTYLELYCTANPNIPQSPELYDFIDDQWQLRLSKKTPPVGDVTNGEYPVWRIAISDSTAPMGEPSDDKEKIYRKKENSVLSWITDDDKKPTFSFQPKQFRNLPISLETDIDSLTEYNMSNDNIGSKPGVIPTWKDYNLPASNILGPTKITKEDDLKKEIELDRIVWFCHTKLLEDDRNKAGSIRKGEWTDAVRIFQNSKEDGIVYLAPNQYLVVGPEESRPIGSKIKEITANEKYNVNGEEPKTGETAVYEGGDTGKFGIPSTNRIDLTNLAGLGNGNDKTKDHRYQYMVAVSNVSGRGLNISEPLWVSKNDPYPTLTTSPEDTPFELPQSNSNNSGSKGFPIGDDKLFGLGTIPGYKSAFLQRVADPNRPYHPLLNPYLTVDWNVMDLTVFNGECVTEAQENNLKFDDDSSSTQNELKIENSQRAFGDVKICKFEEHFSSRQPGNSNQTVFDNGKDNPIDWRPNPWNRSIYKPTGKSHSGLEAPFALTDVKLFDQYKDPLAVIQYRPKETLGYFNDRRDRDTTNWFDGLNDDYQNKDDVYYGSPKKPFEHLIWNDAPFSNPAEIMLVPASAPGRFNQEFVRIPESKFNFIESVYGKDKNSDSEFGSLGTNGKEQGGIFGNRGFHAKEDKPQPSLGPYLNFFHSSTTTGKSLNLCKLFEFVYVPSLYPDAYYLSGFEQTPLKFDDDGNPVLFTYDPIFDSKLREPGKININTLTAPVWAGLSGDKQFEDNTNTPWDNEIQTDGNGNEAIANSGFYGDRLSYLFKNSDTSMYFHNYFLPFMPPHTSSLFTKGLYSKTDNTELGTNEEDVSLKGFFSDLDANGWKAPEKFSLLASQNGESGSLFDNNAEPGKFHGNMFGATEEIQRLSGLLTNRSNVFAVWVTIGYFEVERAVPGVNIPNIDPDGNPIGNEFNNPGYKYYHYYQAIYPDGYTYGKELGSDYGETKRNRSFYIIDRSIPVDFRRGQSANYKNSILIQRQLD
ncbi:MAG: hypothetical protein Q4C95_01315 [Planctomycetia bacterium]|nr:hypothetical protein [Planctomycetia bacterium]